MYDFASNCLTFDFFDIVDDVHDCRIMCRGRMLLKLLYGLLTVTVVFGQVSNTTLNPVGMSSPAGHRNLFTHTHITPWSVIVKAMRILLPSFSRQCRRKNVVAFTYYVTASINESNLKLKYKLLVQTLSFICTTWDYYYYYYFYYYYYYTVVNACLVFQVRNNHGSSSALRCRLRAGKFGRSAIKCCGRLFETVGAENEMNVSCSGVISYNLYTRVWSVRHL